MAKVLVIGGNRFFGKELVRLLLKKGHDVSVLNRGGLVNLDETHSLIADRLLEHELTATLEDQFFDIIFDQICMGPEAARIVRKVLFKKTKKYIMTSSQSVYQLGNDIKEAEFDAENYFKKGLPEMPGYDYGEFKRQAEAIILHQAEIPALTIRFPMVLGPEDYTKRLFFHLDACINSNPVFLPNREAKISFIHRDDAANSLLQLMDIDYRGAINIASPDSISLDSIFKLIEDKMGQYIPIALIKEQGNFSPFGISEDWVLNTDLAQKLGIRVEPIEQWLPRQIDFDLRTYF